MRHGTWYTPRALGTGASSGNTRRTPAQWTKLASSPIIWLPSLTLSLSHTWAGLSFPGCCLPTTLLTSNLLFLCTLQLPANLRYVLWLSREEIGNVSIIYIQKKKKDISALQGYVAPVSQTTDSLSLTVCLGLTLRKKFPKTLTSILSHHYWRRKFHHLARETRWPPPLDTSRTYSTPPQS